MFVSLMGWREKAMVCGSYGELDGRICANGGPMMIVTLIFGYNHFLWLGGGGTPSLFDTFFDFLARLVVLQSQAPRSRASLCFIGIGSGGPL